MSVNHYSTDHHHHTLLWQHRHTTDTYPPLPLDSTTTTSWLDDDHKESLFEKTLTPSDVGKLNRLVIPKQHAEKYFPLNAIVSSGADTCSSSSEKGLLLSFEDESCKSWRFRYSYWNSSQSYVLTKGWSRFVKDKQLDPGDVVFFQRHCSDSRRLFIGWRRHGQGSSFVATNSIVNTTPYCSSMAAPIYRQIHASSNYYNPPPHSEYSHDGTAVATLAETYSIPSSSAVVGSSRTVRLFGVNLECQMDEDNGDDPVADVDSPYPDDYYGQNMYYYSLHPHPHPHPHNMNIAFTGDTMKEQGEIDDDEIKRSDKFFGID